MLARALGLAVALGLLLVPVDEVRAAKGQLSYEQRFPGFDIGGAQDLAASPDGEFLYAVGDDKLTVFDRDPLTGGFSFLEVERDGIDDQTDPGGVVDGIDPARGVAVSPDGKTVYVASYQPSNSVAVFDRDPATGRVSFLEAERDGVDDSGDAGGTVAELFRVEVVAVSPDGESVYATTESDDSVVVFDRDPATGRISYLEFEKNGVNDAGDAGGTVEGLDSGSGLTLSPDGEAVYVSASSGDAIVVFARDAANGRLSFVEAEKDGVNDAGDPGGTVDGLNGAAAVAASNGFLFAAGSSDAAVALFERDDVTQELSFVEVEKNGVDDAGDAGPVVSGLIAPRSLALSPNGLNLYVAGNGADAVLTFRLWAAEDELEFVESEVEGLDPGGGDATPAGLRGASAVVVPAGGDHVYVGGSLESGLAAFSRAATTAPTLGRLSFLLTSPGYRLADPRGAAISPDGEWMVVANLGDESLVSLERDPAAGAVVPRDREAQNVDDPSDAAPEVEGLDEPLAVAFAPNGTDVYVTDTSEYAVSLFRLDPGSGELSYVETERDGDNDPGDPGGVVEGLYEPWDLAVAPDGGGLYVAGNNEDALVAFDRDTATGRISFLELESDGVGGVDGLSGVEAIAISPDGRSVYAAGSGGEEAAVFARDLGTDALTFLEAEVDGVDDPQDSGPAVDGFEFGPTDVAVAPDGSQVYFGAFRALTRFQRDTATGRISFAEVERDAFDEYGYVDALTPSRDGGELYVGTAVAGGGGALLALSTAGGLAPLDAEVSGQDDPGDGGGRAAALERIAEVVVSPDDRFVYSVSEADNGVGLFARELAAPPPPGPPPQSPPPEADTLLLNPYFKAAAKQVQKGKQVVVTLTLKAGEKATGTGSGKIVVGKRSYKLKALTVSLGAGKARKLKLRPAKSKHRDAIVAALRAGRKVKAKLTGKIADPAGNRKTKNLPAVTLTYKRSS